MSHMGSLCPGQIRAVMTALNMQHCLGSYHHSNDNINHLTDLKEKLRISAITARVSYWNCSATWLTATHYKVSSALLKFSVFKYI